MRLNVKYAKPNNPNPKAPTPNPTSSGATSAVDEVWVDELVVDLDALPDLDDLVGDMEDEGTMEDVGALVALPDLDDLVGAMEYEGAMEYVGALVFALPDAFAIAIARQKNIKSVKRKLKMDFMITFQL